MQNRFGLKDFVLMALVIIVGTISLLSMMQADRHWKEMFITKDDLQTIKTQTGDIRRDMSNTAVELNEQLAKQAARLEQQQTLIADLSARIQSGSISIVGGGEGGSTGLPVQDELEVLADWTRSGVEVVELPQVAFKSDPTQFEDFQRGGEFTEIFEAQLPKITPYLYSDVYGRRITDIVLQSLADFDPVNLGEWRGKLADAYQYDPNGLWVRAHINPRARFSDGKQVTAEDVRWTYDDFLFNPEIEAERFRSVYNVISGVKVIDKLTVEFHFDEPMFKNLESAFLMPIVPKHFYSRFTPSQLNSATGLLMGSGPYRVENLNPNNQWAPPNDVILVRNENFWMDDQPPIERLRFRAISDNLARLTSFENGEGDMMRGTYEQFEDKANDPSFLEENDAHQWTNMRSGYSFIAWNCGDRNGRLTPFADKRVRRAMTHLLDRNRMRRDFFKGLGRVCTGPFSPATPQSNPNIKPWEQDIDLARDLLKQAGWIDRDGDQKLENERGDEFTFEFTYSTGSSTAGLTAKYLRDMCAEVGITCSERKVDWSIYQQLLDNRDFDAITMAWSASVPEGDPNQLWHSSSIRNQGDNFAQWNNPEADRLIEAGRRELDFDKRMAIWHEFHALIHEEQPYTFMINPPWIRFVKNRVGNFHPYPKGLYKDEMYIKSAM